jgi:RHS repeat-associated protein
VSNSSEPALLQTCPVASCGCQSNISHFPVFHLLRFVLLLRLLLLFLFFVSIFTCRIFAADKSGVGPNTISLPKGPGAIEGLGESFQPHLNTGTASSGLTFRLPPGTAGHTPALSLSYEGGSGNGPLGFGWTLSMSSIQCRTDEGIPTYGQNVGFPRADTFINDMKEELVPLTNGFLFCKNEGAFIRYQQLSNSWVGTLPNGTRMEFGLTGDARVQDPANTNHIFCWLLQKETDTHGNVIVYTYTNFPGSNNLNQKYLSSIAYGPGAPPWNNFHFVSLLYEDRPDWFEDCRSGFIVRTGKRLEQIVIGTQGPVLTNHLAGDFNGDGVTDYLDRQYVLDYLNYAGTNSYWSLLAKVTEVGADGTNSLPPATYGYALSNPPDSISAAGSIMGGSNEPPQVMDNPAVDFIDLNGDGLPDILATEPGGGTHTAYINQGQSGSVIKWQSGIQMNSADGQAPLFDLQSTAPIAHLADMDGDGLADLAVTALDGSVLYFQNSGRLSWGPRQNMSIQDTAPPSPFGNPDVRTADLDFDKRMDIIQSISTGSGADYRIWFNLGSQSYSASVTVPQAAGFMLSSPGVQIADFNGDRVPDIAQVTPAYVTVTAGLGYGHFAAPITVPIPDVVLDDTQAARAVLMDINGDGLADLVLERAAPGELWYWLNLGNYTFSHRKIITGLPTTIGGNAVVRWADLNGNGTTDLIYADSTASPRLQTVDIGQLINGSTTPNLLVTISNGIGRVTLLNYQPSTAFSLADAAAGQPWPDLMPNPVQVVASMTTLDSLGHQYLTQFRYHNGYYDPVQKQFRGFAGADQIDVGEPSAPTLVTRSFFDTGRIYESMKGKLLALSIEQEDGEIFSVATNSWAIPPVTLYTGTNGTNVMYAHPTGTVKIISELSQGTPRRLESETAYDNYGNQTTNADYGIVVNGDRSAFNDERITTTEYAINTNLWLLRHPARQQIKDYNGNVISQVENYYDDEIFSGNNFGMVTVGNLTLSRAWITPSNSTAFITASRAKYDVYGNVVTHLDPLGAAPGGTVDFSQGHAREMAYDTRFHCYPISETIHVGYGSQALVFQAVYDEGFGTASISSDFNTNVTSYSYDSLGRLISIVRPYDTPAYPTVEYSYALAVPAGSNELVNYVETRQRDTLAVLSPKSAMYFFSRQFVDGLGRKLMTKTEAEPAPGSNTPRVVISEAALFNSRQKPALTLNPCFSLAGGSTLDDLLAFENIEASGWQGTFQAGSSLVSLGLATAHKTSKGYDATLRSIVETNQDGSFGHTSYQPLIIQNYDENQSDPASPFYENSTQHYADGLGRLVQVDEVTHLNDDGTASNSSNTWTNRYAYDLNDNVTQIIDSQNNVVTRQYDGLKRRTLASDPDCGLMSYLYDDTSNLRETVDAKGQHVQMTYDGANRLLTETYVGSPLSPRLGEDRGEGPVNVAYHYDAPAGLVDNGDGSQSMAQNTYGKLAFVSDGSGEQHNSYDARGRLQYNIKRIPDPVFLARTNAPLVAYRSSLEYDSLDRLTRLVYPDNDQITYEYNERGLLEQIGGGPGGTLIISNVVYSPSGAEDELDYGNGTRTVRGYDARLRLSTLGTLSPNSPVPLIAFDYEFDPVSNLKTITDNRPFSSLPVSDLRRNTQAFTYDDLYRLTRVQFNASTLQSSNNFIQYRYDLLGNTLAQSSDIPDFANGASVTDLGLMNYGGTLGRANRTGRQPGDPPGPHALTSLSSTTNGAARQLSYDANGNVTALDGLTNTWDFKDRLVTCESVVMRADYTYDFNGQRISKRVRYKPGANALTNHDSLVTTVYVQNGFELREHDAPTKYVFNGAKRVAAITGSLSSNLRVQRLRLVPGWNLCSLAVTASNAAAQVQGSSLTGFRWQAATASWAPLSAGDTLPAGTVLWLNARTNLTLSLLGTYSEPTNQLAVPPGAFLHGTGLEALPLLGNRAAGGLSGDFWAFDALAQLWHPHLASIPYADPSFPTFLSPGAAMYVAAATPVEVEIPNPSVRIRFYHDDHLGSSSVITDANGNLVEETAFYPFGASRNSYQPRHIAEPYGFTAKERDDESGLHYFGKRFYASTLGKWLSTDPMEEKGGSLNLYAYVNNNPMRFQDRDGGEITMTKDKGTEHYHIKLTAYLVDVSTDLSKKGYGRDQLEDYAAKVKSAIEASYQGKSGKTTWDITVDIKVVDKWDDIKADPSRHVFRIVDKPRGGEAGGTVHGHMLMDIKASTLLAPREAPAGDKYAAAYKRFYKSPESFAAHEFGHDAGLDDLETDKANLMSHGRENDSRTITVDQLRTIQKSIAGGKVNQPDPDYGVGKK